MRILIVILLCIVSFSVKATNYVVIGTFADENNAVKLKQRVPNADIYFNTTARTHYVFVLKTEDHEVALAEARRLQSETEFKDAWVFFDGVEKVKEPEPEQEPVITEIKVESRPVQENKISSNEKTFYFMVIDENGTEKPGAEITALNPTNQRKEYVFTGNQNVTIKAIANSDNIRLECDLSGYRKIVTTLNFKDPSTTDGIKIESNRIIVPFHLVRLKKGDIAILYNVFFYKDAAIMRPESRFDLEGVLNMMNDNPKYKIKIHGHTNGSASGPILEAGESHDYFTLTGAKEGNGSAKKLSQKRAEAIREYLAQQGVDPTRMLTKAWGGKKPIYDKLSTTAYANVRVEVEVIDE